MTSLLVMIPVAAAAVWFLGRKLRRKEQPGHIAPAADIEPLDPELCRRMEEFLDRDRFMLMIQPVVDFRDNTLTNGEVLSRLNHPERGVVFPDQFLPVIENLGLYPKFDRYIFEKTCAWLRRTMDEGWTMGCLSCNFSRTTLSQEGVARELLDIADRYHIPYTRLAMEITEHEPGTDTACIRENLRQLKEAGLLIILDDYGEGISSVDDLMQYPLDIVKFSRATLQKASTEQTRNAYRGLVAMADRMKLRVVCEGIETEDEENFAREIGCRYGQGYRFFKPTSQDQVLELLHQHQLWREND